MSRKQQSYQGNLNATFESMRQAEEGRLNKFWQNVIDTISQCKQAKGIEGAKQKLSKAYFSNERKRFQKSKFLQLITVTTEVYMNLIDVLSEMIETKISDAIKDECIRYANFLFYDPVKVSTRTIEIGQLYADSYISKIINIKRYCDSDMCKLDGNDYPYVVDVPECLSEAYSKTEYGKLDASFQKYLKDYKARQDELSRARQENDDLRQQNEQLQIQYNNLLEQTNKGIIIEEVD